MKNTFTFLIIFLTFAVGAQERYTSEVFTDDEITLTSNVQYATNATIFGLLFDPNIDEFVPQPLVMDVYQPDPSIDSDRDRPMVLVVHGGDGLPEAVNGTCVGSKTDQVTVDTARKLARMGYVAIVPSYRQGWNPLAPTQDLFLDGLVDAALRASTDFRSAVRFLRQDIAQNGNSYGIDPDRFVIWGTSTSAGTYSGFAAYVNEVEETQTETYFVTDADGNVRNTIDLDLNGGLDGLEFGVTADGDTTNYVNTPGFSSAFQMSALGSAISLDPGIVDADEPPMVMFGNPLNTVTQFVEGPIQLPTTGEVVAFVQLSPGLIAEANEVGVNDVWSDRIFFDDISQDVAADPFFMGVEGWLPIYGDPGNAYPWVSWTDACANGDSGNNLNTFPGADRASALVRIDTMAAYFGVRACVALELGCQSVATKEVFVDDNRVKLSPNPTSGVLSFNASSYLIENIKVYNVAGALMLERIVNNNQITIDDFGLPNGSYFAKVQFEDGVTTKQFILSN